MIGWNGLHDQADFRNLAMGLPYREFAVYKLLDLAVRIKTKPTDRTLLHGNHTSFQIVDPPPRGEHESPEQFGARKKEYIASIPRGSDSAERIALAHEAFVRAGNNPTDAASWVFEELQKIPNLSAKHRLRLQKLGIPYQPFSFRFGQTRRGERRKAKRHGYSATNRQIEAIRTQSLRFKNKTQDFQRVFESQFAAFRSDYFRDAQWLDEMEPRYRAIVRSCEEAFGLDHAATAQATYDLARLLHERRDFSAAHAMYLLAAERWTVSAPWPEPQRAAVMSSLAVDIDQCCKQEPLSNVCESILKSGPNYILVPYEYRIRFQVLAGSTLHTDVIID
jgi:hypothetical protein